jgi:hypothetical protein
MQFADDVQVNWQEGYCFIVTIPDPIQPEQSGREFKNDSGNFLDIRLATRTWSLVTSILVTNVSLMTKRLKRRCGNG